jgi:hypothetical protein
MSETIRGKKRGREEKRRRGDGQSRERGKVERRISPRLIESDRIMSERNFPSIG